MILPHCLWRGALRKYHLLPQLQCALRLPSYRSAPGSHVYLDSVRRRPLGTVQIYVQSLCTGRPLLQVRDPNKRVPVQTASTDSMPKTVAQKVTKAGLDISLFFVVVAGVVITVGLFYCTVRELFSSSSPSKIYGKAFDKCKQHPEVIGAFGEPIKGHGEHTTRGRRQHINSAEYFKDGVKCMRLKFYISGSEQKKEGIVHVDVKENQQSGKYEFRYIIVKLDTYPRRTITVEDNRLTD